MKGKDAQFEFSAEVEKVMMMHQDPVNYYHFSRLWMAQLVAMCRGESLVNTDNDDSVHQLMTELRKTDPLKCKKLAARLITPGRCGGPCPQPSFSGAAEFFRDFVLVCNNARFVRHLRDLVVSEVVRLNSSVFDSGDSGARLEDSLGLDTDTGAEYNEMLVEQFQETLITLRILGKFLGFLESFPFTSDSELSSDQVSVSVGVRDSVAPPLDLTHLLTRAAEQGRLVVTIPWLVEFLSQLDQSAHKLSYYNTLYLKLAVIYQTKLSPSSCQLSQSSVSPQISHFLSLYLGWLFEKKTFPREILILAQVQSRSGELVSGDEQLDTAELVSPGLVRQCCPWVSEIRTLLQQWEGGKRGSQLSLDKTEGTYRKITPLAAPLDKKDKLDKESVIQSQLEENFFHNQPKSLRRTVEYVSERLASNIIKKIRQIVVPGEKTEFTEALKNKVKEVGNQKDDLGKLLSSQVSDHAAKSLEKVKIYTRDQVESQLEQDCLSSLELLLAFDISESVKETCVRIAVRTVEEKVMQWVEQHVTLAYFSREYNIEAERVSRQAARDHHPVTSSASRTVFCGHHDPDTAPPSESLINIKNMMKKLLIDKVPAEELGVSEEVMLRMLGEVEQSVTRRTDLTHLGLRALETLTLDWTLTLVTLTPTCVTDSVVTRLISLWSLITPAQLTTVLCPRNIVLLGLSSDTSLSWSRLQHLILSLLRSGLLPSLALEDCCLNLVQLSSDYHYIENSLIRISSLIQELSQETPLHWAPSLLQQIKEIIQKRENQV